MSREMLLLLKNLIYLSKTLTKKFIMAAQEKRPTLFSSSISYGIYTGIALIVYSVIIYVLDLTFEKWTSWLNYAILLAGIILSTLQYRNKILGGYISYGQALGFGVLLSLWASILSGIYTFAFYQFIDPEALNQLKIIMEETYLERGLSPQQVEQAMKVSAFTMKPIIMGLILIPTLTFWGFVMSLITSIFLKNEQ